MPSLFHIVVQNNSAATWTSGVLAVLSGNQPLIGLGASPTSGDPYDTYTFIHATCDQAVEDDGDAPLLISRWGLTTDVNAWVVNGLAPGESQTIDVTASPGQVLSFAARVVGSGDDGVYIYTVGNRFDATVDLFDSLNQPLATVAFDLGGVDVVDCGSMCPPTATDCLATPGGNGDSAVAQTGGSGCTSTSWYADLDSDGFGNPLGGVSACSAPTAHVANSSDCNDNSAAVKPGATEVCNTSDDDCDNLVDDDDPDLDLATATPWYPDQDGDSYGANGGEVFACATPPSFVLGRTDCDDDEQDVHPGAVDVPGDGIDQDCSGSDANVQDTDTAVDTDSAVDTNTDPTGRPYLPTDTDTDTTVPGEACGCHYSGAPASALWMFALAAAARRSKRVESTRQTVNAR